MLFKRKPYFVNFTSLPPSTYIAYRREKYLSLTKEKALGGNAPMRAPIRRQACAPVRVATGAVSH
jgi:hypothetical protein